MADEDDYIPEETPEEVPESTPAEERQGGLTDASRDAIRGGVRNIRNPEAASSQPPAAKPVNTPPSTSVGGKLGKGYRNLQTAKNIKENPQEAAKEAGKEYVKDVAKEQVKKQIEKQVAQKGILGILGSVGWEGCAIAAIILIILAFILLIVGFIVGFFSGGGGDNNPQIATSQIDGTPISGTSVVNGVVLFKQADPRWGSIPYGYKGTLATSACGPTSVAMVLATYGINATPVETAAYSVANGFRVSSGTAWGLFDSIARHYGLSGAKQIGTNLNNIIDQLNNGYPVIVSTKGPSKFTGGGHFLVITGYNNGTFYFNDPGSRNVTESTTQELQSAILSSWILLK